MAVMYRLNIYHDTNIFKIMRYLPNDNIAQPYSVEKNPVISRLLKGARPPLPRYKFTWDVQVGSVVHWPDGSFLLLTLEALNWLCCSQWQDHHIQLIWQHYNYMHIGIYTSQKEWCSYQQLWHLHTLPSQMYVLVRFQLYILKTFQVTALHSCSNRKIDLYSKHREKHVLKQM